MRSDPPVRRPLIARPVTRTAVIPFPEQTSLGNPK